MKILNNISKNMLFIILLIILAGGIYFHFETVSRIKNENKSDIELIQSLNDSLKIVKDELGRETATKQTIRTDLKTLKELTDKKIINLTSSQKELIDEINNLENDKDLINAALIDAEIKIDSLSKIASEATSIDTTNNSILFQDLNDIFFRYSIVVENVKPIEGVNPKLIFNSLVIPNKQFIDFSWDNSRSNTPISFRVKNTNPYLKINNVESYAIPQIKRDELNPSFGLKAWRFIKRNGKYIAVFGGGYAIGKISK